MLILENFIALPLSLSLLFGNDGVGSGGGGGDIVGYQRIAVKCQINQ